MTAGSPVTARSARILIVDDQEVMRLLVRESLGGDGSVHTFHEAESGPEALAAMETFTPDLVVLDVMLPGLDGCRVCETMKADPRLRAAPVIMLSARGQQTDVERGLAAGATSYLVKPFRPGQLARLVARLLEET